MSLDANVPSRTVMFPDGTKKTPGIMLPGEYEFGTAVSEIMETQSGEMINYCCSYGEE